MRPRRVLVTLAVAASAATACSSERNDNSPSTAASTTTTATTVEVAVRDSESAATDPISTTAAPAPTVPSLTAVPTMEGEVGAKADTTIDRCEATELGWIAEGTVTNPTDAAADYNVIVSFLDADSATLGADVWTVTAVPPGESAEWSVEMPVDGDDLQCILRVTRAPSA